MEEKTPTSLRVATWAVRLAFAIVFVVNVQCALGFIVDPGSYVGSYELSGVEGKVAVQGLGVAFLMWNVTYPAVIVNPRRFRALGVVVLIQQVVGLVGESWILATLPEGHEVLASGIQLFINFDAFGLVIMVLSFVWMLAAERGAAKRAERAARETQGI